MCGRWIFGVLAPALLLLAASPAADAQTEARGYASASAWDLRAENLQARGASPWFLSLEEDASCVFEDEEGYRRELRVTDRTESFRIPSLGGEFETAVVEDTEHVGGKAVAMTHHYLAVDVTTGNLYTFGMTIWEDAEVDRSWRAGTADDFGLAEPGLVAPGSFETGDKYLAAAAEGTALVGVEVMEVGVRIETPAGTFEDCVRTRETDLEGERDAAEKCWCRDVGLVSDSEGGTLTELDAPERAPVVAAATSHTGPARTISDDQAAEIARGAVPGEVMDIVVERKMGAKRIVVEVIADEDMAETDVIIDMETGEVLAVEK
jgi:hypothetical protein